MHSWCYIHEVQFCQRRIFSPVAFLLVAEVHIHRDHVVEHSFELVVGCFSRSHASHEDIGRFTPQPRFSEEFLHLLHLWMSQIPVNFLDVIPRLHKDIVPCVPLFSASIRPSLRAAVVGLSSGSWNHGCHDEYTAHIAVGSHVQGATAMLMVSSASDQNDCHGCCCFFEVSNCAFVVTDQCFIVHIFTVVIHIRREDLNDVLPSLARCM